ncbi:MAG: methyltransferase domain-containing protein [Gammaproteobacteria bacterium SHHR-1]|uniref:methyltransferase domain-containing protein n=1 Tax=Magnetovirga frankeli TaxID=947516 RepID=UPI0012935310|nr:methyltransferase domain-containing protein [gamma proteobacterium SS-5]
MSEPRLTQHSLAHLAFRADWRSEQGRHSEIWHVPKFNVWRDLDLLPPELQQGLREQPQGSRASTRLDLAKCEQLGDWQTRKPMRIKADRFHGRRLDGSRLEPQIGRFYPKGMIAGVSDIFRGNMQPMRVLDTDPDGLEVDLSHPMARYNARIQAEIIDLQPTGDEHGGRCNEVINDMLLGPGMQVRSSQGPTRFLSKDALRRVDYNADGIFYSLSRMVQHLDRRCLRELEGQYRQLLGGRQRVLDLMASWDSHLPPEMEFEQVTGLGMNAEELDANPRLDRCLRQDLNRKPVLPFTDASFDAVICSASVEYLTDPLQVFAEVHRVLSPGGICVVSFSNRWFPTKSIALWSDLHEFERMGLVSEYFLENDFADLHSLSLRGLPRPEDDPHYGKSAFADPLYLVWAYRQA